MATLFEMLAELVGLFGDVALNDPVAAVLLVAGTLLFAFTFGVAGVLALGAAVEFVGVAGRALSRSLGPAPRRRD